MGDAVVAWGLLALGAVVTVAGLSVPEVRRRWRETLGRSVPYLSSTPTPAETGRTRATDAPIDPETLAASAIGRAMLDGRARVRGCIVEVRRDGPGRSAWLSVDGVTTGPYTLRVAHELLTDHVRRVA